MAGRRGDKSGKKSSIPGVTITQFVDDIPKGCSTPDFERKPITLTLQEGKNAIFRAVVKGEPKPEVVWKCNSREMDDPQKYQMSFNPGTNEFILQISKITSDDADLYRCTAVNEYGEATCTAGLKIIQVGFKKKTKEAPSVPQGDLKKEIQDFRKTLKKRAPSAAPKKEIDMEQIWQLLLNADRKDYEKICLKYGIVDFRGMLRKLQEMKKEREDKQALYIHSLTNLRHVRINLEKGNASFDLEMELKNPESRIYLYKDGQMINFGLNSDNIKHCLRQVGKKYNFTINDLQPEDAGVYQLKVEDVDIFSTELEAEYIPVSFRYPLGEVRCHEQGNAVFQCTLFDACFNAVWLNKDRRLQPSDKYDISVSKDGLTHRLVIKNTQLSDKGTYTIDIGTRSSSAWLEVEAAKGKRKQAEGDNEAKDGLQSKLLDEDRAKKLRQGEGHEDQDHLADGQYKNGQADSGELYGSLGKDGSLGGDKFAGVNRDGNMGQFSGVGIDRAEGNQLIGFAFGSGGHIGLGQNTMQGDTGVSGGAGGLAGMGLLYGKDAMLGGIGAGTGFGEAGGLQAVEGQGSTLNGVGTGDTFSRAGGMGSQDAMLGNTDVDSSQRGVGGIGGAGAGFKAPGEAERLYGIDGGLGGTGGPGVGLGGAGTAGGLYSKDGRLSGAGGPAAGFGDSGIAGGLYGKDGSGVPGAGFGGAGTADQLYGKDGGLGGTGGFGAGIGGAGGPGAGFGGAGTAGGLCGKDGGLGGAGGPAAGFGGAGTAGQLYGKDGGLGGAGGPGAGFGGAGTAGGLYGKDGGLGGAGGPGAGFGGAGTAGGLYGKDGGLGDAGGPGAGFGGAGTASGLCGKDGGLGGAGGPGAGFGGTGTAGGLYGKDGGLGGAGGSGAGFGGTGTAGGLYGKDGGLGGAGGSGAGFGGTGTAGGLYGKDGGLGGAGGPGAGFGGAGTAGGLYGKDGGLGGAGGPGAGFGGAGTAGGLSELGGAGINLGCAGGLYGQAGMPDRAGIGVHGAGVGDIGGIGGAYGKDGIAGGYCTGGIGGLYSSDGMPLGGGTSGPDGTGGTGGLYGKDGMTAGADVGGPGGAGDISGVYGKDGVPGGAGTGGFGGIGGSYGKDGMLGGVNANLYGRGGVLDGAKTTGSGFGVGSGSTQGMYGKTGTHGGSSAGGAAAGSGDTCGFYGRDGTVDGARLDGIGIAGGLPGKDSGLGGTGTGAGLRSAGGISSKDGIDNGTSAGLRDPFGICGKEGLIAGPGSGGAGAGFGGARGAGLTMRNSAEVGFEGVGGLRGKDGMPGGANAGVGLGGSGGIYEKDGMIGGAGTGHSGSTGGVCGKDGMLGSRAGLGEAAGKGGMPDGAGGISSAFGEDGGLGGRVGLHAGTGAGIVWGAGGLDGSGGTYGNDGILGGGCGDSLGSTGTMHGKYGHQDGILDGTPAGLGGAYGKDGIPGEAGVGLGDAPGKGGLPGQAGAHARAGQSGGEGMAAHPGAETRLGAAGMGVGRDGVLGGSSTGLGSIGGRAGLYDQEGVLGKSGLGDGGSAGGISDKDAMLQRGSTAGFGLGRAGSTHGLYGKDGMQGGVGGAGIPGVEGMRGHYGKDGTLLGAGGAGLIGAGGSEDLYGQGGVLHGTDGGAHGGTPGLYGKDSMIGGTGAGSRFGDGSDKDGALGEMYGTGLGGEGGTDGLYGRDGRRGGVGAGAGVRGVDRSLYEKMSGVPGEESLGYGQSFGPYDAGTQAGDRRRQLSDFDASGLASADISRSRDRKGRGGSLLEEDVREPHCRFNQGLFDVRAQKGKSAVLSCCLNNDQLEGTWFKDEFKVTGLDGVSIEKDGPVHKLIIDNVQDNHAGKYKFEAEGIKTEASIFVEDPPNVDAALLEKLRKEPIVVKAGKNAMVKIPFDGQKPIRATWLKDEGELLDDARINTDHSDNFTRLSISSTNRKDCGDYKLKLRNESGTLEATLKLVVIDKPQPPMGPIEVVDSSTSGITIRWKPPKDDGGKPVQSYTIERQQVGRKTWLTLGETRGSCTIFTTNKVEHDKSYYFRVRAVNAEGTSEALESDEVMAATKVFPGSPTPPKIVSANKGAITLSWAAPHKTGNSRILGYTVEKCKKGSNSWTPVTDLPITDKKYTVTDLKEGLQYEFRVAAVNAAGAGEASAPSEAVFARDPMKPPGPVRNLKVANTDYSSISLSWMKPESEEESNAKGYVIEMRHTDTLKWTQCNALPTAMMTYTVRGLKAREMYFLRVRAVNDGGFSDPVELDTCVKAVPPSVHPKLLINDTLKSFMIVKAGDTIRVRIPFEASPTPEVIWLKDGLALPAKATTANREGLSHLIIPGAEFSDSGHYAIVLRTEHGKKESFSFLVQVIDVPESPGPIQMVENVPDTVTLIWDPSPTEKREGHLNYMVMQRDSSKGSWQMVADLIYTNKCTVANLVPGREYFFRVLAKNYMGISEPSETVQPWSIHKTKGKFEVRLPRYRGVNQNQPPRFLVQLKPHVVTLGFDCHMSCAVTGYPVPQVTWYKDGKNLSQDPTFLSKNDFGVCSLVITGVMPSDGGEYKAVASNELGQASSKATVTIKEPIF